MENSHAIFHESDCERTREGEKEQKNNKTIRENSATAPIFGFFYGMSE